MLPGDPRDPEGLANLAERYLIWSEVRNFAANTVAIRRRHLSRFVQWCDERPVTRAGEVTAAMLERYQRHLFYYRKENGQPLRVSSQSHWLTAPWSWFRWLARHRFIEHNPAADLQLPREEKRLPRHALSRNEVETVFDDPSDHGHDSGRLFGGCSPFSARIIAPIDADDEPLVPPDEPCHIDRM